MTNPYVLIRNYWWALQRAIDLKILWPECVKDAPNLDRARFAFACHALTDRAWVMHYGADLHRVISELQP